MILPFLNGPGISPRANFTDYYRRYTTKVSAAVLRTRKRAVAPDVAAVAAEPTMVTLVLTVIVSANAAKVISEKSMLSPIANSEAASIAEPSGSWMLRVVVGVAVTMPPSNEAAVKTIEPP